MRYDKHKFAKNKETKMVIKAMTLDFCPHPDPPGWKPITHPEGVLYFYNEEKKTVTDANLYDPVYYEQITSNIATLEEHVRSNSIRLPERYTLAMDLNMQSHKEIFTDYYYADHDRKVIFFLDDLDTSTNLQVWNQVKGVTSLAHVRHEFEAQYWTHGMLYPSTIELTDALVADLRAILLHFIGDTVTSSFSTSPYSRSELRELLSDVTSAKENVSTPLDYHGTATFICRLMWIFARNNFYHRYSGPEVRLYADQSAHGKAVRHRTILMKVLSPLLFSAPDSHLRNFESAWVDGILSGAFWLDLYKKLNSEAQEYNLTATVMLNVNVAFLAIQSVDLQESQGRSPGQVAAYLSVACSLGSIVAGLLLTRHLRKNQSSLDSVAAFLKARSHPTLALELLSILHSLPYAFLLWAMISFLVAFIWHTADNSDTVTRLLTGIAWAMLAVCVAWYVWVDWAQHDGDGDQSPEAGDGGGTEADSGGELGGQETATGFKPVWIRLWERLRGGLFRISRQSPSEGTQQLADGTRVEV
ncbi:hypothetical protein DFP72DRAFT_871184 [Ephemerocybe angulata]|uniref:Uncharacterized protein n=1 Tax=Ephemerocybe angulata TaxID=980116 RepID=A0A8H6IH57_9AGAR|nr:hypothetical protein DFP72DRAFT_871184 [Tulosesus angulatus]